MGTQKMDFPGLDGFLGNRASFMLDVVFTAMFVIVPTMAWSIYQVKYNRRYALHKRVQLGLALLLFVAVALFEIDVRLHGWRARAAASPFYDARWAYGLVNWSLWIHLVFAVSTFVLWAYVVVQALRHSPMPPAREQDVQSHRFWAKLAAIDMAITAVTGCTFYTLAFVL
jgi:putative membrane protein